MHETYCTQGDHWYRVGNTFDQGPVLRYISREGTVLRASLYTLIHDRKKIQAIKVLRDEATQAFGQTASLLECKNVVEALDAEWQTNVAMDEKVRKIQSAPGLDIRLTYSECKTIVEALGL